MAERLQRIEVKKIDGKIQIMSGLTDSSGGPIEPLKPFGTFKSERDGHLQMLKHQIVLLGVLLGNGAVVIASIVVFIDGAIEGLTHYPNTENAYIKMFASLSAAALNNLAARKASASSAQIENAQIALENAVKTEQENYTGFFSLQRERWSDRFRK